MVLSGKSKGREEKENRRLTFGSQTGTQSFSVNKFAAMVIDQPCQQLEPQHDQIDLLQTVRVKHRPAGLVSFINWKESGGEPIGKIGYLSCIPNETSAEIFSR